MLNNILIRLLVASFIIISGCSNNKSGDSSEHGLLGDDTTVVTNTKNGTKDNISSTSENNSTSNKDNNTSTSNSEQNNTTKNTTNGNGDTNSNSSSNNNTTSNNNIDINNNGGTDSNTTNGNSKEDGNTTAGDSNSGNTNTTNGNDDNTTLSEIKSINLKVTKTKLNKDSNTSIKVTAKTKDNKQIDITQKVKWLISPKGAVIINKNTLIAKKDINTTIQAKYKNLTSNRVLLNIYWEADGHILPPEPDPKVNNATLLGVDVNKNGVRDDVERWIYKTYKEYRNCHKIPEGNYTLPDGSVVPTYNVNAKEVCSKPIPYHPVVREAVMEIAKQAQIIIQKPEDAVITDVNFTKAYGCALVIIDLKDENGRKLSKSILLDKKFKAIQFNTVQRARAYAKFNYYLSGGVYEVPNDKYILENWCSPKIREMIKGLK